MSRCPSCGTSIEAEAIEAELGIAHCEVCGTVSAVGDLVEDPDTELEAWAASAPEPSPPVQTKPALRPSAELQLPPSWSLVSHTPLVVERSWTSTAALPLVFFTLIWDGFLVLMLFGTGPGILCMPHAWIGLALSYYCAAVFLNKTRVAIEGGQLTVQHAPLPWGTTRPQDLGDIEQLYVERSSVRVNKQPRWNLAVLDRMGRKRSLLTLMASNVEARELERLLEDALGIVDRPVEGEDRG